MQTVFVSFPYRDANADLRQQALRLVESFDLRPITGESLGGNALQSAVLSRVDSADALIAFMTKTDKLDKGGWGSTDWVKTEFLSQE